MPGLENFLNGLQFPELIFRVFLFYKIDVYLRTLTFVADSCGQSPSESSQESGFKGKKDSLDLKIYFSSKNSVIRLWKKTTNFNIYLT